MCSIILVNILIIRFNLSSELNAKKLKCKVLIYTIVNFVWVCSTASKVLSTLPALKGLSTFARSGPPPTDTNHLMFHNVNRQVKLLIRDMLMTLDKPNILLFTCVGNPTEAPAETAAAGRSPICISGLRPGVPST